MLLAILIATASTGPPVAMLRFPEPITVSCCVEAEPDDWVDWLAAVLMSPCPLTLRRKHTPLGRADNKPENRAAPDCVWTPQALPASRGQRSTEERTMYEPLKKETDIMSPEGVEERVKYVRHYTITMTQGGKYRVYSSLGDGKLAPLGVRDTMKEAMEFWAMVTGMEASMVIDPKRTMDVMLDSLRDKEK